MSDNKRAPLAQVTFAINPATGALIVEGRTPEWMRPLFSRLGAPVAINCARPQDWQTVPVVAAAEPLGMALRLHRIYRESVVDGPGRRVVVQVQGCPIRCPGCYVPQTHNTAGGAVVDVADVMTTLAPLLPTHDGVTILGGEPFAQPLALVSLVTALRLDSVARDADVHICVYSGYTVSQLLDMGPIHRALLGSIDLLIDGPFIAHLSAGAGQWRGSTNQGLYDGPALQSLVAAYRGD